MRNLCFSLLLITVCSFSSYASSTGDLKKSCESLLSPISESAGDGQPIEMRLDSEAFRKSLNASVNKGFSSYWNDRQKSSAMRSVFKNWHQWRLSRLRKKTLSQQPTHQMEVAKSAKDLVKAETWAPENTNKRQELLEVLDGTLNEYESVSERLKLLYLKAYVHYASYRLLKKAYDYHLPTEDTPLSIKNFPIVEVDQDGQGRLEFKSVESYQNRYAIKSDLELHKKKWQSIVGYVFKKGQVGVLEAEQAQLRANLKTYRWAFNDAKLENRFNENLDSQWNRMNSLLENPELQASSFAALNLAKQMRVEESARFKDIKNGEDSVYEAWVDQLSAASEGVVDRKSIEKGLEDIGFKKVQNIWQQQYTKVKDAVKKQANLVVSRVVTATIFASVAVTVGGAAASQWDKVIGYMESATDSIVDKGLYVFNLATDYEFAIDRIARSQNFELEKSIFIDTYFADIRDGLLDPDPNNDILKTERAQELREILLETEWRRFEYQSDKKEALLSEKQKQVQLEAYEQMLKDLVSEVNYLNVRMIFLAIEDKRTDTQAHTFIDYLKSVSDEEIDIDKAKELMSWYRRGITKLSEPPKMDELSLNIFLKHMLGVRKSYDKLLADNPDISPTKALSILLQDDDYKPFVFGDAQ